jgi:uncharacterized cofD-like protein
MRSGLAAVGGGHGLARALQALRLLGEAPTAVVTTADDGGSSGRLRRDLGIIALGDLRMALLTLARNQELAAALTHRFQSGQLEGHALGNLLLVGLAEQAGGDFVTALERAADLLDCAGRVLPSTTAPVQLKATVSGEEIDGQVRVATASGRVERVWLEPSDAPACPEAVAALREARTVVLGPGSLFTSVIATLLVPGLAEAVARGGARVIYLGNIRGQPGETSGLDAQEHVHALLEHVPGLRLNAVILHQGELGTQVEAGAGVQLVATDLAAADGSGHDPQLLADALEPLL